MCSSTGIENDALKDIILVTSYPFWKSSVGRMHRLREESISSCSSASPIGLDHPEALEEGLNERERPSKGYQISTAGLLPPRFMFQSFKQLAMGSELFYMAVQRILWKSWKFIPSICADQCNKPYCSHSRSDASKKEREGRKWREDSCSMLTVSSCCPGSLVELA